MRVFDLHCDTISACLDQKKSLLENDLQLDLKRGAGFSKWVQTFAFFIEDEYRGDAAWNRFEELYRCFCKQEEVCRNVLTRYTGTVCPGKCNVLLSIEGGAVLGGKLERIPLLKERGISMLTLTWNGKNELGGGALSDGGLTPFGKEAVRELEQNGILVDVSHLNDTGFWELTKIATCPVIATHSNARACCPHPRNLTDDQLRWIIAQGGLIGLNFYSVFVNLTNDCTLQELCQQAEHILSLGGEQNLALGSDFDGAAMPQALSNVKGLEKLYAHMVEYLGNKIADRIFFENAEAFAHQNRVGEAARFR